MEEEVQELRRKLERAEARLNQKEGTVGVMTREVQLERELDEAHDKLLAVRKEKQDLELSVQVRFSLPHSYSCCAIFP